MARSLNKVMLIGNLGSDPEVRSTGSGTKVAKLSVATNRTFNDRNGQKQEKTEWHRVTFWGKLADIVEQYAKKGDRMYVEGRIEYSQYTDKEGVVKYGTDIIGEEIVLLGGGGGAGGEGDSSGGGRRSWSGPSKPEKTSPSTSELSEPDDDLPF